MGVHSSDPVRRDNIQRLLDMLITEARNEIAHNGAAQPRDSVLGQAIETAVTARDPSGLVALLDAYVMEAKNTRDLALAARERARAERAALAADRQRAAQETQVITVTGDTYAQTPGEPRRAAPPRRRKPRRTAPRRDVPGLALRPDPLAAQDAAGLMAALRAYRQWAGQPSFRDMEARCEHQAGASTMCKALKQDELPDLWLVDAIVTGCGGPGEDRDSFTTAWRVIAGKAPGAVDLWLAGAHPFRPALRALPQKPGPGAEEPPLRPAAGEDGR